MKVSSTDIREIWRENRILYVRFSGDRVYKYYPVSAKIYVRLCLAQLHGDSVGRLFHRLVKKAGKNCQRV